MKNVLCTGGSGSLGSALCAELAPKVDRLVVFSRDWLKQSKLRSKLGDPNNMRWFIGDVRDRERLERAFGGIDTIIHAAAIKDIVSGEYAPSELVKTNIIGTYNVIEAAIDVGVKNVLLISTDKSVASSNAYGKSKAVAESLAVASNSNSRRGGTTIAVARYGNVLESSGSVVPVFQEQMKTGEISITDKRMTRFVVTMAAAVKFVISCIENIERGVIFIPKLYSVRILDIAEAVAPGIPIKEVGIRPGEKLHEMLITPEEGRRAEDMGGYYAIPPEHAFWDIDLGGKLLPDGFSYTSDNNSLWLSAKQIRELIL